jgi:hypothetical protein
MIGVSESRPSPVSGNTDCVRITVTDIAMTTCGSPFLPLRYWYAIRPLPPTRLVCANGTLKIFSFSSMLLTWRLKRSVPEPADECEIHSIVFAG